MCEQGAGVHSKLLHDPPPVSHSIYSEVTKLEQRADV